jgi:hypothetical protein
MPSFIALSRGISPKRLIAMTFARFSFYVFYSYSSPTAVEKR